MKTIICLAALCFILTGTALAAESGEPMQKATTPVKQDVTLEEALDIEGANVTGICYSARGCTGKVLHRSTTPQGCKHTGGKSIKIGSTCARL